jgi:hypothetical protein
LAADLRLDAGTECRGHPKVIPRMLVCDGDDIVGGASRCVAGSIPDGTDGSPDATPES